MSRKDPKIALAYSPGLPIVGEADLDQLRSVGTLLNEAPLSAFDSDEARAVLAEADVLVGHWGCPKLDEQALAAAPSLGLFAYAAGTVKMQVSEAVWDRDIRVTSGANANAEPVAEFTLAAILFANKGVFWRRGTGDPGSGIADLTDPAWGNYDRTIGIVSASLIGRRVIELLQSFPNLRVQVYDPFVTGKQADAMGAQKVELDELCASADVLSIHAPALPETMNLIGEPQLEALRDGATIINTARGPILDHAALIPHVSTGRLFAILDVTDPEPLPADSPLRELSNVWLSPHLAGSQGTEIARMTECVVEEIRRWSAGEPALNEVTQARLATMA